MVGGRKLRDASKALTLTVGPRWEQVGRGQFPGQVRSSRHKCLLFRTRGQETGRSPRADAVVVVAGGQPRSLDNWAKSHLELSPKFQHTVSNGISLSVSARSPLINLSLSAGLSILCGCHWI